MCDNKEWCRAERREVWALARRLKTSQGRQSDRRLVLPGTEAATAEGEVAVLTGEAGATEAAVAAMEVAVGGTATATGIGEGTEAAVRCSALAHPLAS